MLIRNQPLSKRTLKSKLPQARRDEIVEIRNRPATYKHWSSENMTLACEAVQKKGMSVRRAAEEYHIPRSTIFDRLSGKVEQGAVSGPVRYLNREEEAELVKFFGGCATIGYARTRKQVIALVEGIVTQKRGTETKISNGWWEAFRKRHPELALRKAERLAYCRAVAADQNVLDDYFCLLQQTLQDNHLIDKPGQIFNCDESGFPLEHKLQGVVALKGSKHPSVVTANERAQITVLACINAAGSAMPPMVVFDRKILKDELAVGEVPGTAYGLSDNGWMNGELFDLWFHNHFLSYVPSTRPLLLLLDGHSSHYNPTTVRKAAEEGVIMFTLPPHTTHLLQPLDKTCFGVLKTRWHQECQEYITKYPGRVVTKFQFSKLFSKAWYAAMTMQNVIAGFRVTGVCPLDPDRFLVVEDLESERAQRPCSLAEATGLAYIPLYSPAPQKRRLGTQPQTASFSPEQVVIFQRRYENGYDLDIDPHYNLWLQLEHPEEATQLLSRSYLLDVGGTPTRLQLPDNYEALQENEVQSPSSSPTPPPPPPPPPPRNHIAKPQTCMLQKANTLSKFLKFPTPPAKRPVPHKKPTAKLLTRMDNLKIIEEKEKRKQEEAANKEKRKQEREQKAKLRAEQKAQAAEQREKRKQEREEKAKRLAQEKEKRRQERERKAKRLALEKEERRQGKVQKAEWRVKLRAQQQVRSQVQKAAKSSRSTHRG